MLGQFLSLLLCFNGLFSSVNQNIGDSYDWSVFPNFVSQRNLGEGVEGRMLEGSSVRHKCTAFKCLNSLISYFCFVLLATFVFVVVSVFCMCLSNICVFLAHFGQFFTLFPNFTNW